MSDIYNILSISPIRQLSEWQAAVSFNPDHVIYKAHFPNNPITPGVILLQVCKKIIAQILPEYKDKTISDIKMIKFTGFIVPQQDYPVTFDIVRTDDTFRVNISSSDPTNGIRQYAKLQFSI